MCNSDINAAVADLFDVVAVFVSSAVVAAVVAVAAVAVAVAVAHFVDAVDRTVDSVAVAYESLHFSITNLRYHQIFILKNINQFTPIQLRSKS